MERGRILILGNSKETTYEIRSLLDNQKFELEIALSAEVGKLVLNSRRMNLVMVHAEMLQSDNVAFFDFLRSQRDEVPVAVLGEEALSLARSLKLNTRVRCFDKPYVPGDVISFIKDL